ncbi:hypothetical protein BC830DRAFT_1096493 [Chytriomyces sp. MP71]|nr:hypothetical protein BC830DRAFT_1096493 [Chytriomyces sp. MP71]
MSLVFLAHAILEGNVGLMGLIGMMTNWFSGPAILFGVETADSSEALAMAMCYSVLAAFGGAAYLLQFLAKKKHFETLMAMAFGGVLYHFLLATSILTGLFDPASPSLPFPSRSLVLAQLSAIPGLESFTNHLSLIAAEDFRVICGSCGVMLHACMGVWFVRFIVDAADQWDQQSGQSFPNKE